MNIDLQNEIYKFPELNKKEILQIEEIFECSNKSKFQKNLECLGSTLYAHLSEQIRLKISSVLKSKQKQVLPTIENLFSDSYRNLNLEKKMAKIRSSDIDLIITHDVDYRKGKEYIPRLLEIESKYDVKATYFFLVNGGYKLDKTLLRHIADTGHEIGLHGVTYDLRLAYRSSKEIFNRLVSGKKALEDITGKEVVSFRNHSLIYSDLFPKNLELSGFKYSSNIYPRSIRKMTNTNFCWPFVYKNSSIVEIPVSWPQDSECFRSQKLDEQEVINMWQRKAEITKSVGGIVCHNHHPSIISEHEEYYSKLLNSLAKKYQTCTINELKA